MTKAAQAVLLHLTSLSVLIAGPAAGCIGPPSADLWNLVDEASEIVVVDVRSVRPSILTRLLGTLQATGSSAHAAVDRISPDAAILLEEALGWLPELDNGSYVATLDVLETLRGSATGTFEIGFGAWGAVLLPGEAVVLFLRHGRWSPRLLDYSNSVVYSRGPAELRDLRSAILAAIELQRHPGDAARRDWALAAARLPGSRPHVLGQLKGQTLAGEHQRLLAESFVRYPTFTDLEQMLAVLEGYRDPLFDRRAAALISAALSEPEFPCWASSGALEAMLTRLGKGDQIRNLYGCRDHVSLLRLWRETLKALDFPAPGSTELAELSDCMAEHQRLVTKLKATYRY